MRWHTFESLARVLCAGVLGYFGYQMLVGHNPFGSGPPSPLLAPLFLGVAAYQLFQAWKGRKGFAGGETERGFERYGGGMPVDAHAVGPAPGQRLASREQEMQEEMGRLRIAAATDPKAAMMLRTRLRKQLAASTAVHDDERHEAIRRELADLEKQIKLLQQYKG